MKHIARRIIWTKRILIFFILVIILFIFINLKIDRLRENIRYGLEKALSEATGEKVNIGVISGGLISGILCEGIFIGKEAGLSNNILLKTGNIRSNVSILNFIFYPSKLSKIKLKINSLFLYTNPRSLKLVKNLATLSFNNFSYIFDSLLKVRLLKVLRLNSMERKDIEIVFDNFKIHSDFFTPLEMKQQKKYNLRSPKGDLPLTGFILTDNFRGNILINPEYISFHSVAELFTNIKIDINGNISRSEDSYSKIVFKFNNPNMNGEINIFGKILSASIEGYISLARERVEPLQTLFDDANASSNKTRRKYLINGDINFNKKLVKVEVKPGFKLDKNIYDRFWPYPENRKLEFNCNFSTWPVFRFYLSHILVGNLDLSTNISLKIIPAFEEATNMQRRFFIHLITSGTIVNFMPFEELTADFIFSDEKLELEKLKIGENISGSGSIYLKDFIELNLSFLLNSFSLEEFKNVFSPFLTEEKLSGIINGKVKLKGDLKLPESLIFIKGKDGMLADMEYDRIVLKIKGIGSKFKILDGVIYTGKTKYKVEGDINVSKIGNEGTSNIELESQNKNSFIFEKWQVVSKENKEIDFTRSLGKDFMLRFTAVEGNEEASEPKDPSKLEIEYKLSEDKSLKMQLRKEAGIVGIEKSIEF